MATHPIRIAIDDLPAHLATLEAELRQGNVVELVSGEDVIAEAHLPNPVPQQSAMLVQMPDFMTRLKAIYGENPLEVDTTAWVREDRDGDDDLSRH